MDTWHSHQFRLKRSGEGDVRWWIDLLLFDTLVRDCIQAHGAGLRLWRIHRRAMDDAAGHEFMFLCYAAEDVHHAIDRSVTEHPALGFLRDTGLLRELLSSENGSAIGATSDAAWPLPLQETWPYYIDGVSRMALELIDKLRTSP